MGDNNKNYCWFGYKVNPIRMWYDVLIWFDIVLKLYCYCTVTVLILQILCWSCTDIVLILYCYCTDIVLLLYWYCTDIVLILYWYCIDIVLILYWYCTVTVLYILGCYPVWTSWHWKNTPGQGKIQIYCWFDRWDSNLDINRISALS